MLADQLTIQWDAQPIDAEIERRVADAQRQPIASEKFVASDDDLPAIFFDRPRGEA